MASAWYQYALIRKSITWLESWVNACLQSFRSVAVVWFARLETSLRTCAMQLVKSGGSLGRSSASRARRLALGGHVHPVVERRDGDRVAGDVGHRIAGDAASAAGDTGSDHKKGAKRHELTYELHQR